MKILVIGYGSIGERHIRNLKSLSAGEITACGHVNMKRLSMIGQKYGIQTYPNLKHALNYDFDAALVCTPTSTHIPIAFKVLKHGTHLFIEKPISHTLKGVDELIEQARKRRLVFYAGYHLRFHAGLRLVKKMLTRGEIGKVLSARAEFGQYLPDWRPWQDYRRIYYGRRRMGGGIILEASHELDYLRWLLGEVEEVSCFAGKLSHLEVDTEDNAEITLKFRSRAIAGVHLDFTRRDFSRNCEIRGEEGSIIWSYPDRFVKIYSARSKRWRAFNVGGERNEMYVREMKHFLKCVQRKEKPLVDGIDGKKALEIALAAKKSAKTGKKVKL